MNQYVEYLVIAMIVAGAIFGIVKGFEKTFFSWFTITMGAIFIFHFASAVIRFTLPKQSDNVFAVFGMSIVVFLGLYLLIIGFSRSVLEFLKKYNLQFLGNILGSLWGSFQMLWLTGLSLFWLKKFSLLKGEFYTISLLSMNFMEFTVRFVGNKVSWFTRLIGL